MQVMYTKSIHHFFLLSQILLDVYLMYTKNVHHGNVIHTVYTICLQKVYYQCSNFGKGSLFKFVLFLEYIATGLNSSKADINRDSLTQRFNYKLYHRVHAHLK